VPGGCPEGAAAPAPGRLAGRVAVVTGASRGIGRAIAERFAAEGARVLGASRGAPADGPAGAGGAGAAIHHIRADVSVAADAQRIVATAVERFGRLDVLVNNAAIEVEGTIEETSPEDFDAVMAVNARGVFLCARAALGPLRERGGAIVNVASIDGHWAEPGLAAYSASKGAVIALTRAIALDHGPEGIRCSCICPSYVRTPMLERFYDAQADPAAARDEAARAHPLRRLGEPADVAALALWLASDEAAFATGQAFVLDGGLTAGRTWAWGAGR
jgi:NAD(P)-dependent dehydrogenase (short-subunit alcohol dehydrogenase family)